MGCEIRTQKFLRTVKTQSKIYRNKLQVDINLIEKIFLEERRLELGRFRHGERFCNYDQVVAEIQEKWLKHETHGLCQEIIHSTSNRINDIILTCIYTAMLKEICKIKEEHRKKPHTEKKLIVHKQGTKSKISNKE